MRRFIKLITCLLLLAQVPIQCSLSSVARILGGEKTAPTPQKNTFTETLDRQIAVLDKEKSELKNIQELKSRTEKITQEIAALKEKTKTTTGPERELLSKKLALLTQQAYPALIDLEQVYQQLNSTLESNISAHQEYKEDPEFKALQIPKKSYYVFDDLQSVARLINSFEEKITLLEEKKKNTELDIAYRKKAQTSALEEYRDKKKQQEEFSAKVGRMSGSNSAALATARQEGEFLDAQEQLLSLKKELNDLKLKEAEHRLSFIDFQILVIRNKISLLKNEYNTIKRALRVDDQYVSQQQTQLERKRTASLNLKNHYYNQIRVYAGLKEDGQKQLSITLERLGLQPSDTTGLSDWTRHFTTIQQWIAGAKLGTIIVAQNELDVHKEYIEGQIELEKNRLLEEELNLDIIRSWNKMTMHKFALDSDEEINNEIRHYETQKTEIEANLSLITERQTSINSLLNTLNRSLANLRNKNKELRVQQDRLFKDNSSDYAQVAGLLNNAQEHLTAQIDLLNKLLETYTQSAHKLHELLNKIDTVIAELKTKSWWVQVSEVKWEQLRTFTPSLNRFFNDYKVLGQEYFSSLNTQNLSKKLQHYANKPFEIISIILYILAAVAIYFFLRFILSRLSSYITVRARKSPTSHKILLFGALILDFIHRHLISIWIWFVFLIALSSQRINDVFINISFYLLSIPFLIYIAYKFFMYFRDINIHYNYIFIGKDYERRFITVVSLLTYASITILFFRQAFLLSNFDSDVPTILLALNFILLQIALISLIGKEHILSLIPTNTPLWEWIEEHVSKYYYLLLAVVLSVIILSNPYLGYGRLVLPIFLRILLTLSLIPLFSWLYSLLRKTSLDLFFTSDDEVVKERFNYSKTWHGFFVILTLVVFLALALLVGARIWNYPLSLRNIGQWLRYEISIVDYDAITGRPIALTLWSLIKTVLFVFTGIVIAFIVNRFILKRIFDPGLVGVGLQNTLLTLSRYIIVITALLIGLNNVGMSNVIVRFFLILVALGFALKEPLSDFFCYFILLVQRPIKIGDLIMIDSEVVGIVRQITPRSVILRKKNSVTLIVPNSQFITRPITNWSYTRTFFAFNDIMLTVNYSCDPALVRDLIIKVLELNPHILKNPPPFVVLSDFVDNGYQFLIRGYLSAEKVLEQHEIASEVRMQLVKMLRTNNMEVACPTRVLKVIPHDAAKISGDNKQEN